MKTLCIGIATLLLFAGCEFGMEASPGLSGNSSGLTLEAASAASPVAASGNTAAPAGTPTSAATEPEPSGSTPSSAASPPPAPGPECSESGGSVPCHTRYLFETDPAAHGDPEPWLVLANPAAR